MGHAWSVRGACLGRAWGVGAFVRRMCWAISGCIARSALLSGYLGKSGHLPRLKFNNNNKKFVSTFADQAL